MAAAINKYHLLALCVAALAFPGAQANDQVIDLVRKDALYWRDKFEDKIGVCTESKKSVVITSFEVEPLKRYGVSRNDALKALLYLGQRNFDYCDQTERVNFSYALSVLDATIKHYRVTASDIIPKAQEAVIYPSTSDLELRLEYEKLPETVRSYLEARTGTTPFSFPKTLDAFPQY
jgi:hypothetical protein